MREQATTTICMMGHMERGLEDNMEGHDRGAEVNLEYLKFTEFQNVNPQSFQGTFNPNRANEWIKATKKIFSVLAYTKEQKVAFATYMLEVNADF